MPPDITAVLRVAVLRTAALRFVPHVPSRPGSSPPPLWRALAALDDRLELPGHAWGVDIC